MSDASKKASVGRADDFPEALRAEIAAVDGRGRRLDRAGRWGLGVGIVLLLGAIALSMWAQNTGPIKAFQELDVPIAVSDALKVTGVMPPPALALLEQLSGVTRHLILGALLLCGIVFGIARQSVATFAILVSIGAFVTQGPKLLSAMLGVDAAQPAVAQSVPLETLVQRKDWLEVDRELNRLSDSVATAYVRAQLAYLKNDRAHLAKNLELVLADPGKALDVVDPNRLHVLERAAGLTEFSALSQNALARGRMRASTTAAVAVGLGGVAGALMAIALALTLTGGRISRRTRRLDTLMRGMVDFDAAVIAQDHAAHDPLVGLPARQVDGVPKGAYVRLRPNDVF